MGDVITIGIAGGTGSGKTTITRRLLQRFPESVSVVYHDNYYKAHDDMTYEQRSHLKYDCPDAFDTELLLRDLAALRRGEEIRCPVYDYTVHNRSEKTRAGEARAGGDRGGHTDLRGQAHLRPAGHQDLRGHGRRRAHTPAHSPAMCANRGRSLESVVDQYLTTVKPMHEMYVEPSKRNADIIIPEGGAQPGGHGHADRAHQTRM